ncbi:MAG: ABC transporter ATP-binding protein [Bacteroidota bacterium]
MNTLKITHLKKTYPNGVKALNDISFTITNGMFGLLGPNGSGKSSLMRTIAGLQAADSGSIEFNGVDILSTPAFIKKQLGYLPQDFGVYPKTSALNLLEHLAILKGIANKQARKEQILLLLEKTNLYDVRNKEVYTFSGGMRQRFGIAQALLGNPQIIVVDEPTAGLDPEERHRFNNLLSEIGEQIIVILSTHMVDDVRDLCTDMAMVYKGSLMAKGSPQDFIQQLRGSIWSKTIAKQELTWHRENFRLISSKLNAGKLNIHVYSETEPSCGFTSVPPDLEDVYFTKLSKCNGHA